MARPNSNCDISKYLPGAIMRIRGMNTIWRKNVGKYSELKMGLLIDFNPERLRTKIKPKGASIVFD